MSLWREIEETMDCLDSLIEESRQAGLEYARDKAAYYSAKARAVYDLKQDGMPATVISMVVKGDRTVNSAMHNMDVSEVAYRNSMEAINVMKKRLDTLREQYSREWGQAGRN